MRIVTKVSLSEEEAEFDGKSLTKEQMIALLEYYRNCVEPRRKEFLEMFFFAFHACGLRVVDVMTLQWKHIDFTRRELRKIMIKTNKRHVIPLTEPALHILRQWQEKREGCRYVFNLVKESLDLDDAEALYKARNNATKCINQSLVVTEEQAYNATQDAVWRLLHQYNIEDNNMNDLEHDALAQVLYVYSERGGLLNYEPSLKDVHLTGDLKFTYNPKDGYWHSGALKIIEPVEYNGLYRLELPKGMSALCDNITYVYGNEEYELVSDHQPTIEDTFTIKAEFVWMKDFKQYAPMGDVEVHGKKFQNMVGAVIRNTTVSAEVPVGVDEVGSLSITKKVVGEKNCQEEFQFEIRFPYHTKINGLYGDLEFHDGIAQFSLKDGQTVTAHNLPAGAQYEVTEAQTNRYKVDSVDSTGEIIKDDIKNVLFTNTKYPDLSLSKIVTGKNGDKTKPFTFTIQLKDETGKPINGTYHYSGSVKPEFEKEAEKPADGTLTFVDGRAEISLLHGQQITLQSLPLNAAYVVTENEANKDRYITTYNGKKDHAEGVLSKDTAVDVINNRQPDQAPSQGKDEENPDKVPDEGTAVKTGDYTNIWQYAFTAIAAFIVTASVFGLKEWKRKR